MTSARRWTLRTRLRVIVGLSVLTLLTIAVVDLVSMRDVDRDLSRIEGSYLPLLDLGPRVRSGFISLSRALEEAASAQDLAALQDTQPQEDKLLALLDRAPSTVSPHEIETLQRDIDDWYATAYDVSTRLIQGKTGESLTEEIRSLQTKRSLVEEQIQRTVVLDRRRLSDAFQSARQVERSAAWIRTGIPIGLTALLAALALGISRQVDRTLGDFARGFERFGRGEFDEPIRVAGEDELALAARHANRMAANLRELNERLRRRQADLERANQELEAFSYSVSHDLRAPLRSIDGFSQALVEDYGEVIPEEGKQDLARVRKAAQRMAELIDDMLRLSRVSRAELHLQRVDLSNLAREVARELSAAQPSPQVEVTIPEGMVAEADGPLLRIVLENLMGNAWKFSSRVDHPHIEVGMVDHEGEQDFFVSDNGVGFDMKYAGKLFAPFQRLHGSDEFAGTGIGLATVARVVHRHGGRVWAEGAVGRGATFHFTLPGGDRRDSGDPA